MAQIRYYDEMAGQSAATVEKIRAQVEQIKIDNERYQKESEARIAQLNAEQVKLLAEQVKFNKKTRYYLLIALVIAGISFLAVLCSAVLLFLARHGY